MRKGVGRFVGLSQKSCPLLKTTGTLITAWTLVGEATLHDSLKAVRLKSTNPSGCLTGEDHPAKDVFAKKEE